MVNVLLVLEALSAVLALTGKATEAAKQISDLLATAHNENRDLTAEEVAQAMAARNAIEDHLLATLKAQDDAEEAEPAAGAKP